MQNFKQYLTEAPNFAPWHIREPEKIQNFIKSKFHSEFIQINKNGTVSAKVPAFEANDFIIKYEGKNVIGLKFKTAKIFRISNISSLWGLPDKCQELVIGSEELDSFEHCTPIVTDSLSIYAPNLKSFDCHVSVKNLVLRSIGKCPLSDIRKHFHDIQKIIFGVAFTKKLYRQPMLEFCKLNTRLEFDTSVVASIRNEPEIQEVIKVMDIIYQHGTDIIACQRELIEKDLDEYAEL